MSSIDSPIKTNSAASKRKMPSQAKVCLTACIGLFAVTAYLILGLNSLVVAAWNLAASNWLQTAVIISASIAVVLLIYAFENYPVLMLKFVSVVALVGIPFFWYGIATYAADDGSHPVPLTLIIPMLVATILFAYCGSRHFSAEWGSSTFQRLLNSFIVASAVSLFVAGISVVISIDSDRSAALAAAEKAFTDLHQDQFNVARSEIAVAGRKFGCMIDNSRVWCREAR